MRTRQTIVALAIICVSCISGCAGSEYNVARSSHASRLKTHYVVSGSGEPVVLVHGFSQTHVAWFDTPLYNDLISDHKVIAVDLLGHGDSEKPHDPTAYGPNMQSDLVKLLDHLEIDKAHFVGFSLGASIVGDLLIANPERVETATMGSGFFSTWDEEEEAFAQFVEARTQADERAAWEPDNQDYRALAAVIRGARYSVLTDDQIASINKPTLMVFGSIELETMAKPILERIEKLPKSITVLIIDGADHDSPKAAILSNQFAQAVRGLISLSSERQR